MALCGFLGWRGLCGLPTHGSHHPRSPGDATCGPGRLWPSVASLVVVVCDCQASVPVLGAPPCCRLSSSASPPPHSTALPLPETLRSGRGGRPTPTACHLWLLCPRVRLSPFPGLLCPCSLPGSWPGRTLACPPRLPLSAAWGPGGRGTAEPLLGPLPWAFSEAAEHVAWSSRPQPSGPPARPELCCCPLTPPRSFCTELPFEKCFSHSPYLPQTPPALPPAQPAVRSVSWAVLLTQAERGRGGRTEWMLDFSFNKLVIS